MQTWIYGMYIAYYTYKYKSNDFKGIQTKKKKIRKSAHQCVCHLKTLASLLYGLQ